ncbi:alpha beta hydrolase superfamily protein [Lacticaseibacillus saniviri JCM 17471 = DSM 24301]|uniref:Alpha beta hydrolase superfamily protein n=1 Tax=Lacticaseibacillus saniviri JCM 17471 = DSM 24301 TaxID=1293598 RepID=A0A0R2MZD2_9LACO|nr:alpha/beta hydrolase [Lacticaseibacillus saniviri]KRO18853.1 alpha beta hydrolase superfamily protein [Lacticaseibacillus saniviri JCM 17471 = DSM 24301]
MIKKYWRLILLAVVSLSLLAVVMVPAIDWMTSNVKSAEVVHNSRMQPVILIPGSSASQERFNTLITMLNKQTTGHSLLKITVQTDGTLKYSGQIARNDNEPYIVVAFENNKDGYANIKKQAKWFSIAFKQLAKTYQFNRFRGIGHSNGGLIYTLFLEKYFDPKDVTLSRLMTIGTPYNLEESNIENRTQMLSDMISARKALPTNLTVYSIAGTENLDGDGTVPISSVEAGKYIFQNQVKHYTQITVSGDDASHSDLPQNQQIVSLISQYIVSTPNQRGVQPNGNTRQPNGAGVGRTPGD